MRRTISIVVAVMLTAAVIAIVATHRTDSRHQIITLHGLVGPQTKAFFADAAVRDALNRDGYDVRADVAPNRKMPTSDLKAYDFALAPNQADAAQVQHVRPVVARYLPFSTPV